MKYFVTGVIRCTVDANSETEAEEILSGFLEEADMEYGIDSLVSVDIEDAEEV